MTAGELQDAITELRLAGVNMSCDLLLIVAPCEKSSATSLLRTPKAKGRQKHMERIGFAINLRESRIIQHGFLLLPEVA